MPLIDDLRSTFGKDLSDDELLVKASDALNMPMGKIAQEAGIQTSGKWTNRIAGSLQAGTSQTMGAVEDAAEALGLPGAQEWAEKQRVQRAGKAAAAQRIAHEQGAVQGLEDIKGIRDIPEYIGGQLVDTGAALATGLAGGAIGATAGAAVGGPVGGVVGGLAGTGAALFPSTYGQMREAATDEQGNVDKGLALGLSIPMTALNLVGGGEAQLVKGMAKNIGERFMTDEAKAAAKQAAAEMVAAAPSRLDLMTGVTGAAARTGASAARTGAEQAGIGVAQAGIEQYARTQVDPNATMGDADYLGAGVGGFALGGTIGALHRGWARSDPAGYAKYLKQQADAKKGQTGESVLGAEATMDAPVKDTGELQGPPTPEVQGPTLPPPEGPLPPSGPDVGPQPPSIARPPAEGVSGPLPPSGSDLGPQARGAVKSAFPVPEPAAQLEPTPEQRRQKAIDTVADQTKQEFADRAQRGLDRGVPEENLDAYHDLEKAHKSNAITDDEFATNLGLLKTGDKTAKKEVTGFLADAQDKIKEAAAKEKLAQAGITEPTGAEKAPAAPLQLPEAPKPVDTGPSPGAQAVDAYIAAKVPNTKMSEKERQRVYLAAGLDREGHWVSNPLTYTQVAQAEHARDAGKRAKPVGDTTIQQTLRKFGFTTEALAELNRLSGSRVEPATHEATVSEKGTMKVAGETAERQRGARMADEAEHADTSVEQGHGETAAKFAEGFSDVGTTNESKMHAAESVRQRMRKNVRMLADAPRSSTGLNDEQRQAFSALHEQIKEKEGEDKVAATQRATEAARALIADEKMFPDEGQRSWLQEIFKGGKAEAAETRNKAAVEAVVKTDKGPTKESEERRQIMHVLKTPEEAAKLRESLPPEQQKKMDEFLKLHKTKDFDETQTLEELVPASQHKWIEDAPDEWNDGLMEGDPKWDELTTPEQASWINVMARRYSRNPRTGEPIMSAREYARSQEEHLDAAKKRIESDKEQARGQGEQLHPEPAGNRPEKPGAELPEAGARGEAAATEQREPAGAAAPRDVERHGEATAHAGEGGGVERGEGREAAAGTSAGEERGGPLENVERQRLVDAQQASDAPLTVEAAHGLARDDGTRRSPSVIGAVRKLTGMLRDGALSAQAFANRIGMALEAHDERRIYRMPPARVRGADHIRAQLLEARRRGDLHPDGVEFADWLLRNNPQLAEGMGISIRKSGAEEVGTSGFYNPINQIVTLLKGSRNTETAVHEILHHAERMMPPKAREALTNAWARSLADGYKKALKSGDAPLQKYYQALMDYHFNDGSQAKLKEAEKLLKDGKVDYQHYQNFNPSEFWAINGTRIMQGRFGGSPTALGRLRTWMREFVQKAKGIVGMKSDSPIFKALDAIVRGDGSFQTGKQLSDQPGVHFMYGGEKGATQERRAMHADAVDMEKQGFEPEDVRRATGWFRNPYDNQWRDEFSDHRAAWIQHPSTLKESEIFDLSGKKTHYYKMGEVLDHPELYARYPEAADIPFMVRKGLFDFGEGLQGWQGERGIGVTPYAEDHLGTVVHELQHWVQEKEGFAIGGSSRSVIRQMSPEDRQRFANEIADKRQKDFDERRQQLVGMRTFINSPLAENILALDQRKTKLSGELAEMRRGEERGAAYEEKMAQWSAADSALRKFREKYASDNYGTSWLNMPQKERYGVNEALRADSLKEAEARMMEKGAALMATKETIEQIRQADPEFLSEIASKSPEARAAYQRLAGEIEARDVTARLGLSEAGRAATEPLTSEDIHPTRAIVSYSMPEVGKSAESLHNIERPTAERVRDFDGAVKAVSERLPPRQGRWAREGALSLKGAIKTGVRMLSFTEDLARQMQKAIPSVKPYIDAMHATQLARRQREQVVAKVREAAIDLSPAERAGVNKYLKASTMEGKWGYDPEHLAKEGRPTADQAMKSQFNALTKAQKDVVRAVFEHGHESLLAMKRAVNESVSAEYDKTIQAYRDAGDAQGEADTIAKKAKSLAEYARLMAIKEDTPYAPLKRFGDYMVVGKSQAYLDAEEANSVGAMRRMQADPNHYYVAMRETRGEAAVHADEVAGQFANVDHFRKDDSYASLGTASMMAGFTRMKNMLARDKGVSEKAELSRQRMLTDLYYSMLSEGSARQAERQRKKVGGSDDDMLRSFLTKGKADANFIAMLESNGGAMDALANMRREAGATGEVAGTTRETRQDQFNEIARRHAMSMDWRPTPKTDRILSTTSYWTLLASPASWFTNAMQPITISAPVMAGKHGMARSLMHMTRAYKEVMGPLAKAAYEGRIDDKKLLSLMPEKVRDNIKELMDRGHVSSENNFDLHEWDSETDPNVLQRANTKVKNMMGNVEMLNRVTTAIAAIRMEQERGNHAGATDYAGKIIYDTHGDYSGFNTPSAMRSPVARVITQFRKFQLMQIGMYGRLLNDAFKGATPEERWVAKKSLGYSLASMGVWGGAMGLPFAQLAGALLGTVFGDADEPDNQELTMRKLVGNDDIADLLLKGVPAALGVDMSGRIGAGNLGNPLPFGKLALDRKSMTENVVAALGPFVGSTVKVGDGLHKMMSGDIWKGTEELLPNGFANAVKGMDIAVNGIRQSNGDVAIAPEELSVFDGVMQGLGLPTTKVTNRAAAVSAKYDSDTFFKDRATAVKKAYVEAHRDGDSDKLSQAREDWANLQAHRKADGYNPEPLSTLLKAPQQQAKREKQNVGGVRYAGKKDIGVARQLEEIY